MSAMLYDISGEEYHDDPFLTDIPTLSAGIAHILCTRSPRHAWAAHPKLNPDVRRVEDVKFDVGTAAHALLLEGRDSVHVVDALDWRTNAAKDERDAARSAGKIPMLPHQWDEVQAMCASTRDQLDRVDAHPALFTEGRPEQVLVWEENGVFCRSRMDWLRDDRTAIDDYKTTSASANPEAWAKTMVGMGADIQMAFYLRGLRALNERERGTSSPDEAGPSRQPRSRSLSDPQFRFVVQETYPPYALSVATMAPTALAVAEAKVDYALRVWESCLRDDHWPAYRPQVASVEAPPWELARWLGEEPF